MIKINRNKLKIYLGTAMGVPTSILFISAGIGIKEQQYMVTHPIMSSISEGKGEGNKVKLKFILQPLELLFLKIFHKCNELLLGVTLT
jgi:hypothetical protein